MTIVLRILALFVLWLGCSVPPANASPIEIDILLGGTASPITAFSGWNVS